MLVLSYVLMGLLGMIGMFLIFIILLQRGRGGGLAGALGGMGGQSAFGTKAGDMFTRITVVLAIVWIVLCAALIPMTRAVSSRLYTGGRGAELQEAPPMKDAPAKDGDLKDFPAGEDVDAEKSETESADPAVEKTPEQDDAAAESDAKSESKTEN